MSSNIPAKLKDHYETFLKLQSQRINQEFCDVRLEVDEKIFPAHKNVLAAASDYFYKMFTVEMKEQYSERIEIKNVTTRAMEQVLNCIYIGEVAITDENVAEILQAASMMQLHSLIQYTRDYMRQCLNPSNCCFFLELANLFSFDELIDMINKFFLKKFVLVSQQPGFLRYDIDTIETILSSDELTVEEEMSVFDFLVRWINKNQEERKKYFIQLFRKVRLQFIPMKDTLNNIGKHALVKEFPDCWDIVVDAFSFYTNPNVSAAQKQRKCFASTPDSIMLLPRYELIQHVYNFETDQWKELRYAGFSDETIHEDSAMATDYPISIFCGGIDKSGGTTKQIVRFDGIRWMEMPAMTESRCGAAAVISDEILYVFGGETQTIPCQEQYRVNDEGNPHAECFAATYEMFGKIWAVANLPINVRRSFWEARAVDNKIYLIGGFAPTYELKRDYRTMKLCKDVSKDTFVFNPADNSWKKVNPLMEGRAAFGCAVLKSFIFAVGGYGANYSSIISAEFLDTNVSPGPAVWTGYSTPFSYYGNGNGPCTACSVEDRAYVFYKNSERLFLLQPSNDTPWSLQSRKAPRGHLIIPYSLWYASQPFVKFAK